MKKSEFKYIKDFQRTKFMIFFNSKDRPISTLYTDHQLLSIYNDIENNIFYIVAPFFIPRIIPKDMLDELENEFQTDKKFLNQLDMLPRNQFPGNTSLLSTMKKYKIKYFINIENNGDGSYGYDSFFEKYFNNFKAAEPKKGA